MYKATKILALLSAVVTLSSCGNKTVPSVDTSDIPVTETSVTETTTQPLTTTEVTTTTTMTSTTTVTTTTSTTTTPIKTTTSTTTTTQPPTEAPTTVTTVDTGSSSEEFIGTFSRGTFYTFGTYGGSGRTLVSGYSIASRALYERYGYGDYKIRIECAEFPELNGVYSLDDCSAPGNYEVIDFWFAPGNVPGYFKQMGVLEVKAWIIY